MSQITQEMLNELWDKVTEEAQLTDPEDWEGNELDYQFFGEAVDDLGGMELSFDKGESESEIRLEKENSTRFVRLLLNFGFTVLNHPASTDDDQCSYVLCVFPPDGIKMSFTNVDFNADSPKLQEGVGLYRKACKLTGEDPDGFMKRVRAMMEANKDGKS